MRLPPQLQSVVRRLIWNPLRSASSLLMAFKYRLWGRPKTQAETSKARQRRLREGFFEKYCGGKGLDIGYGGDLITPNSVGWDCEHGNAQYLKGLADSTYDFVYSSHTLEHMTEVDIALKNWWRVLKRGGYLILYLPHRDLYEKKTSLPSFWNADHKHFFLLHRDEGPDTIGLIPALPRSLSDYEIVYAKECSEGHTITAPEIHSDGEYSIEIVIRKKGSDCQTRHCT